METLASLIEKRDVAAIKAYMKEHDLVVREGRIVPRNAEATTKLKAQESFWNQRQQARGSRGLAL